MTDWRGGAKLRARVPARERRCVRRVLVLGGGEEMDRRVVGMGGEDITFFLKGDSGGERGGLTLIKYV